MVGPCCHQGLPGSMALLPLQSVLSVAQVTTESHLDVSGLGCCLRNCAELACFLPATTLGGESLAPCYAEQ